MNKLHGTYRKISIAATSTLTSVAYNASSTKHSICDNDDLSSSSPAKSKNKSEGNTNNKLLISRNHFKSHSFDPELSMSKGKIANLSCVQGFQTNHMEVGVCVAQNMRSYQEDCWVALGEKRRKNVFSLGYGKGSWFSRKKKQQIGSSESATDGSTSVFAVFDGHGGDECSTFAAKNFQSTFEQEFFDEEGNNMLHRSSIKDILENTLLELDRSFISQQRKSTGVPEHALNSTNFGGSTAVVVAVCPQKNEITCSNVGDSRAILVRKKKSKKTPLPNILPLSSDHSPNLRPDEVKRIENLGGAVRTSALESALAHTLGGKVCARVYHENGIGGLNMTRSLGDDYLKPLVIPNPETITIEIEEDDLYLVLASDGIWDVLSNEDVGKFITHMHNDLSSRLHPSVLVRKCALLLVQKAQHKGSQDNITCMVVQLPKKK